MVDGGTRLIREPQVSGFKGLQGRTPFRMDGALNLNPVGSRERHSRDGSKIWRPAGVGTLRVRLPAFRSGPIPGGCSTLRRNPGRRLATDGEVLTGARDAQTGWNAGKKPGPGGGFRGRGRQAPGNGSGPSIRLAWGPKPQRGRAGRRLAGLEFPTMADIKHPFLPRGGPRVRTL